MFTWEWLTETFVYEDGWLYQRSNGKVRGAFKARYVKMMIQGREYYMHRLVWFYHNKTWPLQIDHADGNGFNNRIENLREATPAQNRANSYYGKLRGVELHGAKWRARIWVEGNRIELGSYDTVEEAQAAFAEAADRFYGEFAEVNRNG